MIKTLSKIFSRKIKNTLYGRYLQAAINEAAFKKAYPVQPDELCIVCSWGIGDTLMAAGLASEIKKEHHINKVMLLVKPGHKYIASLFPSVDRICLLQDDITYINEHNNTFVIDSPAIAEGNYVFAHFERFSMPHLIGYNGITLFDCYKVLFKIDMRSVLEQPVKTDADAAKHARALFARYGLTPGNTVLLATGANSISSFPAAFWLSICKALKATGLDIVLNSEDMTNELKDYAKYIDIPLNYLPAFSIMAGNVIAIRSGLCDLLSLFEANLTVLYPKMKWFSGSIMEGSSLLKMGFSETVTEFEADIAAPPAPELFSYLYALPRHNNNQAENEI